MTDRKKAGIYTKSGDLGTTALGDKTRVSKAHHRIQAVGTIDELNSILGLLVSYCSFSADIKFYRSLQSDLFLLGAMIGGFDPDLFVEQDRISFLEEMIDEASAKLEPLHNFILPGGSPESSWLHLARATCRRAERDVVTVQELDGNLDPNILIYLNRLSDLFFVLARKQNKMGKDDILWQKNCLLRNT